MLSEPIEGLETLGCAERNCPFTKHLGGMRTNGGCKCLFEAVRDVQDRRDIQRLIQWKDDEIARLRAENAALRAHLPSESVIYCIRSIMDADGVRYGHETYLDEIESYLSDVDPFIVGLAHACPEEE